MKRVFIFGGCTSRDAVNLYPEYGLELHSYIARQSLISAYHPAHPHHWDFGDVSSLFQQRMFGGDIQSTIPRHVLASANEVDLIVWDNMIERVGVRPVLTGGYVTNSPKIRENVEDSDLLGEWIKFGSDRHMELWSGAFERFYKTLEIAGLADKIIVNGTPWALVDRYGETLSFPRLGITANFFNAAIEEYWSLVESKGIPIARVAQERAIADPDHKWGLAYFHYVPDTYVAQLEAISRLL